MTYKPDDAVDWRANYLRQRRRTHLWTTATVVALALLGGSVALNLTTDAPPAAPPAADQPPRAGQFPGRGTGQGLLDRLFHEDGTLDREAAERLIGQTAQRGGGERLRTSIETAVQNGTITRQQADELLALLDEAVGGR